MVNGKYPLFCQIKNHKTTMAIKNLATPLHSSSSAFIYHRSFYCVIALLLTSCYSFVTKSHCHSRRSTNKPPQLSASTKITMPPTKEEEEPQTKKVKREETEAADESEAKEFKRNKEGDAYFDLGSAKKRCTVKTWKKNVLVDIREVSSV